jgi:hypothetical protein
MKQEFYKVAKNDARVLQIGQKLCKRFNKLAKNEARALQIGQK